ncbi:hydroxyacylglutathione hydrolase [Inhella inkyongensis]|uniref:Hydroxyacylglutathione hydrolase n=1 Tax=Inhella inkyongensis TaxID=392593 RepID=A0A840S0J7_9BURK|nr:hydroxyacylglutathione hydrolase [Inhella inkyongensis]
MLSLLPVPAFADNYIWLLHDGRQALAVDPGEAAPLRNALQALGLQLAAILVTHHHADHVGGISELGFAGPVYGPAGESIAEVTHPLQQGDRLQLLGQTLEVLEVPGHTAGHIAYFVGGNEPILFCGDTLFGAGCGRLFEGSPAQMLHSLDQLAALPDATRVCCAHEYTLSNLRFAQAIEPDNPALQARQRQDEARRAAGQPTLPSRMDLERATNPFLRSREPGVIQAAARAPQPAADTSPLAVFTALRAWKNQF